MDMMSMFMMQSQMAAQSMTMLQQLFAQMAATQSMQQNPCGQPPLNNYCFPPAPNMPWGGMMPWGGGTLPYGMPPPRGSNGHCTPAPPANHYGQFDPAGQNVPPRTVAFINAALAKQGAPYVPGAVGQGGGYDCSGLVYRSLKDVGVQNPRMAARFLQADYKSSAVSRDQLKPGDLLFFWSPNDRGIPPPQATHVEVYLGNGMSMGTDNPKEGARVEPVNWNTFVGGARVPELQA